MNLIDVLKVYEGSKGDDTLALYARLNQLGAVGQVAVNLFRAQKSSSRAKVYRGGGYRGKAYDRKQWSMDNLTTILAEHAEACGIRWGWGEDSAQEFHCWVLYVELPTGQVSFHTSTRGAGPDYSSEWDRIRDASAGRICRWISDLLTEKVEA